MTFLTQHLTHFLCPSSALPRWKIMVFSNWTSSKLLKYVWSWRNSPVKIETVHRIQQSEMGHLSHANAWTRHVRECGRKLWLCWQFRSLRFKQFQNLVGICKWGNRWKSNLSWPWSVFQVCIFIRTGWKEKKGKRKVYDVIFLSKPSVLETIHLFKDDLASGQ